MTDALHSQGTGSVHHMPMIHLRHVTFQYGEEGGERPGWSGQGAGPVQPFRLSVDHLAVSRGERAACIGASGTGKTTLVNLIAGILVPDSGTVHLGGTEISIQSDARRRAIRVSTIGMVFQEFELLEYLSAGDNILLPYHIASSRAQAGNPPRHRVTTDDGASQGLRLTPEVRDRASRLADEMKIGHLLRRRPSRLSQGERQRVAICRALVVEPQLVICDEPTGNLDPDTAGITLDLLFDQADRSGATLLMVTHNHGYLDRFTQVIDMADLDGGSQRTASVKFGHGGNGS